MLQKWPSVLLVCHSFLIYKVRNSRRRKIKCNGARPQCRNCVRRNQNCEWPEEETGNTWSPGRATTGSSEKALPDIKHVLSDEQASKLIQIFFAEPSLALLRLSFHQPQFIETSQAPLLLLALYSTAALFLSNEALRQDYNGENALDLSEKLSDIFYQTAQAQSSGRISEKITSATPFGLNVPVVVLRKICSTGNPGIPDNMLSSSVVSPGYGCLDVRRRCNSYGPGSTPRP